MARRRHSRSKVRSNRRKRRVHRNARKLLRNLFGADVMRDVVTPVVGGTAGFVLARYVGNMASHRIPQLADPRYGKLAAAAVLIPATFAAARMYPGMVRQNAGAVVLGVGLATAESFLRNTPLLGGAPSAAALTPSAPAAPASPPAAGSYYNEGMLSGLGRGYDLSHAGAPYQGMLGLGSAMQAAAGADETLFAAAGMGDVMYATAGVGEYVNQPMGEYVNEPLSGGGDGLSGLGDPGDQGQIDGSMNRVEAISTIIPTDVAMRAQTKPQVRPVTTPFAAMSADKGYAGGMFARHLFSGMLGS
jgi:hypothetical protein